MTSDIVDKYDDLRTSISGNINAIRALLWQADKLNTLVCELSDDDQTKAELETSIKELYKLINQLIKQTNSTFQHYAEFAQSVQKAKI